VAIPNYFSKSVNTFVPTHPPTTDSAKSLIGLITADLLEKPKDECPVKNKTCKCADGWQWFKRYGFCPFCTSFFQV